MSNLKAKARFALAYLWVVTKRVYANLTPSQRRKVYAVAVAAGVALAVKLGVSADTAGDWITTGVTFFTSVIVPAFANSKVEG